ncbi:hypothetical protein MBH78_00755 [Oceanimonas sp. NS1]|nr:hypothetical protein [Oceanimonas sp. NS1]
MLVRSRPERGVSIRTWLRKGLAWLRRRREQQQRWLRSRLFRSLAGSVSAPRAMRSRAWWREWGAASAA